MLIIVEETEEYIEIENECRRELKIDLEKLDLTKLRICPEVPPGSVHERLTLKKETDTVYKIFPGPSGRGVEITRTKQKRKLNKETADDEEDEKDKAPVKRKLGRPRTTPVKRGRPTKTPVKRGRPRKTPVKRGRPRKKQEKEEEDYDYDVVTPVKRRGGRPLQKHKQKKVACIGCGKNISKYKNKK